MKSPYYSDHAREFKRELSESLDRDELIKLHRCSPALHFLIVARQLLILGLSVWGLVVLSNPLLWIPLAFAAGFTVFNFTVLLHEAIHNAVFDSNRPGLLMRIICLCYAFPSGISASQFQRWHLDHHIALGSKTEDPKRFYLSPKVNKRWVKMLYFTPVLFGIYFRAAAKETATYPTALQKTIKIERIFTILFQLSLMALAFFLGGWVVMLKVYVAPVFGVFPIAFALNRMGQHYNVNPDDPANWSTLVKDSVFWNFWFLWSNFHLEHHYFPGVPFYRLARLHRLLQPVFKKHGIRAHGYADLFYHYIIKNNAPHTFWDSSKKAEVV